MAVARASGTSSARCSPIAEPEVRAQAAKVLGEANEPKAFAGLISLVTDASPRVRLLAAIAVGKLGRSEAIGPLLGCSAPTATRTPTCGTPA